MIRKPKLAAPRDGFTLIELLIVIAILATLVALIVPAVMKVMDRMNETKARTEIAQLETALQAFSNDHNGVPLPSSLRLFENNAYPATDPLAQQTLRFLRRAFGKNIGQVDWNLNGQIDTSPITLTGSQCLVFYCGGPGGTHGFSNSNTNPMSAPGTPYYQFVASRLQMDPNAVANNSALVPGPGPTPPPSPGFPVYWDSYSSTSAGVPYAFFSSNGVPGGYSITDCSSIGAVPWVDTASTPIFVNPTTYQILCAGRNHAFGNQGGTTPAQWSSLSGTLDRNGRDDQANFSARLLMAGSQ